MTVVFTKKSLVIKGRIAAATSLITIFSYIAYYVAYYEGLKLDELYFITTGLSISVFTFLLFTMLKSKTAKTFLIFASVFYLILILMYVIHWWLTGLPYAWIKTSLIIGFIAGLTYYGYDTFTTSNDAKN